MSISFSDLLKLTWKSLRSDWVRSSLTGLGVFMGVAAVSATLNVADVTDAQIEQKLAARDKPYIIPYLDSGGFSEDELNAEDAIALQRAVPELRSISSVSQLWGIQSVQYEGNDVENIEAFGVSQNYIETTGRQMLQGRFFNAVDFDQYRPVVILDRQLATTLLKGQNPINQAIYASGTRLTVIGVVETKSPGQEFRKIVGTLWIPKTLAETLARYSFSSLQIAPHRLEAMPQLEEKVKRVLSQRHPQATVFTYGNAEDLLKEKELQKTSSRALAVVGLIALAIGGVGIANITIAAVLERTKEIGLRRAIGATRLEIMLQFILEATLISLVGGVGAIATVHGLTQLTTTVIIQAPYEFSLHNAALSMGAAIAVGVGSSFLPALRATQIDVVAALRSE